MKSTGSDLRKQFGFWKDFLSYCIFKANHTVYYTNKIFPPNCMTDKYKINTDNFVSCLFTSSDICHTWNGQNWTPNCSLQSGRRWTQLSAKKLRNKACQASVVNAPNVMYVIQLGSFSVLYLCDHKHKSIHMKCPVSLWLTYHIEDSHDQDEGCGCHGEGDAWPRLVGDDSGGSKDPVPRCRGRLIAMLVFVNTNDNNTERINTIFYS